jgi:hypothetical protein
MTSLPQEMQDLLARCLDNGAASDWQKLYQQLAAANGDAGLLDAYAETCALHHDLRCLLAPAAGDAAFLKGIESTLDDQRKNSGRFVLEVAARTGEQFKQRKRAASARIAWATAGVAALVLLAAGFFFLQSPSGSGALGRIVRDGNVVQLSRGGVERPARAGESLFADDVLRTGAGSESVEIELTEKATLTASPNTNVVLRKTQPYAVELKEGKLVVSVGPHPKDHPFVIRTPHADAEVLGTRFSLEVDTERTRLDVFESKVRLRSVADSHNAVVDAGFSAEARPWSPIVALPTKDVPLVATFQQGKDGYAGARDAVITTQNAEFTDGNGATQFDAGQYLICNFKDYQMRVLMRFEGLSLPPHARVESAQLEMKWENWDTARSLRGAYLNVDWNPKAREMSGLGWLHRDNGADWAKPGADDDKKDRVPGLSMAIPTPGNDYVTRTRFSLDASQVQRWIDTPASNHGIILWVAQLGDHTRVFAAHANEQKNRPTLVIRYTIRDAAPVSNH